MKKISHGISIIIVRLIEFVEINIYSAHPRLSTKLDKDADGDVDFKDLKSIFAGGGGIVDKVKGMFN